MAEPEEKNTPADQAPVATMPPWEDGDDEAAGGGPGKFRQLLVLAAGVVAIAAGAGYGTAMLTGCGEPESAQARTEPRVNRVVDAEGREYHYEDFEPITVNLDEPRLARYICIELTLAVPITDYDAPTEQLLTAKKRVLRDWLTVYFASCTLDDVRGAVNLNRLRREVLDAFNEQLWPGKKGRIHKVLFKKFTVS